VIWWVPAGYALFLALLLYRYVTRQPRLTAYSPQTEGPLVSVIVPARDEAANIETCVRSILATAYAPIEVIVVDDRSSDRTAAIVERLARLPDARDRLRLLAGAELPEGWVGKQWALVQGFRVARGELLIFADADTFQHRELIPRAVRALTDERVDLVTVLSHQSLVTFWERLIQPHVFVALATRVSDLRRVNRTRVVWDAIANGQFILTTRRAYERAGSHAAVKASIAEDMALAQEYVRREQDIFLLYAIEYLSTRMYRSLAGILEGWTKNLALGVPLMFPPIRLVRRAAPWVMWMPALCWILPPLIWAFSGASWAAVTTALSVAIWILVYWATEAPLGYALLYPVGAALVAGIMMRSAWRGERRIEWRGRVYKA
jgi:chlorobactene glucosyltransferase